MHNTAAVPVRTIKGTLLGMHWPHLTSTLTYYGLIKQTSRWHQIFDTNANEAIFRR